MNKVFTVVNGKMVAEIDNTRIDIVAYDFGGLDNDMLDECVVCTNREEFYNNCTEEWITRMIEMGAIGLCIYYDDGDENIAIDFEDDMKITDYIDLVWESILGECEEN